jgi:hypothetical protein
MHRQVPAKHRDIGTPKVKTLVPMHHGLVRRSTDVRPPSQI